MAFLLKKKQLPRASRETTYSRLAHGQTVLHFCRNGTSRRASKNAALVAQAGDQRGSPTNPTLGPEGRQAAFRLGSQPFLACKLCGIVFCRRLGIVLGSFEPEGHAELACRSSMSARALTNHNYQLVSVLTLDLRAWGGTRFHKARFEL